MLFSTPPGGIYLAIFAASPCLVFAIAKIGKNCQPLCGFPSCLKKIQRTLFFSAKRAILAFVKVFPLACIKFCLQNFLRQKGQSLLSSRLPLGGKLLAEQGDEGRLNYLLKVFKQTTNPAPFANLYSIAIYDLSGNFCVTFGITKDRMPFSYFALMSSFETSSPT